MRRGNAHRLRGPAQAHDDGRRRRGGQVRRASRLDQLDAPTRELVETISRGLVAKLLHEPSVRLREQAGTPQGERNAAAVADLILELHALEKNVLIVVTHSLELAGRFPRHTELREGLCKQAPAAEPR